jgi:hypothetical protein
MNKTIDLDITYDCNVKCIDCSRFCRQAPCKDAMTVGQVRKFINESNKLKMEWDEIRLLGGEPTVHPKFLEIVDVLRNYRNRYHPRTKLMVFTHGASKLTLDILSKLPSDILVLNTSKKSNFNPFFSHVNIAPCDIGIVPDPIRGCWLMNCVDLGLTPYGYYTCTSGACIDRVLGFDIGSKTLPQDKLEWQREILCKYCGYYLDGTTQPLGDEVTKNRASVVGYSVTGEREPMTQFWVDAFRKFKESPPKLTLY